MRDIIDDQVFSSDHNHQASIIIEKWRIASSNRMSYLSRTDASIITFYCVIIIIIIIIIALQSVL